MAENQIEVGIENIGRIDHANIIVDGITVIAGKNNVGKSTVGKVIYALLGQMHHWKTRYDQAVQSNIEAFLQKGQGRLEQWCMETYHYKRSRRSRENILISAFAGKDSFRAAIEDYQIDQMRKEGPEALPESGKQLKKELTEFCVSFAQLYRKQDPDGTGQAAETFFDEWSDKMMGNIGTVEMSESTLQQNLIIKSFQEVFRNQYRKYGTKTSTVAYKDSENKVSLQLMNDTSVMEGTFQDAPGVHFIESPKIYDLLSDTRYGYVQKEYCQYLMQPNIFDRKTPPDIRPELSDMDAVPENRSDDITKYLENIIHGKAEFRQKVGLEFTEDTSGASFHAVNVSMGVKAIALLEYGLRIGAICPGDILILDEPELNLHPEWQVEYARTLVKMQKELEIHVLITSHSPYFIRAIEVFTDQAGVMDRLNVYRFWEKEDAKEIKVTDVMSGEYGITDLYDDLSSPLDELEEIAEKTWQNDGT